jgi:hypothetical protein
MLFELLIEIRIGEAALRPMLLDDNVAFLRREVRMPFAAQVPLAKVCRSPEAIWLGLGCRHLA